VQLLFQMPYNISLSAQVTRWQLHTNPYLVIFSVQTAMLCRLCYSWRKCHESGKI